MESAQILLSLRVEKVDGIWTKVKADLRAIGNAAAQRLRQIHRGNPKNHILTVAGDVKMILAAHHFRDLHSACESVRGVGKADVLWPDAQDDLLRIGVECLLHRLSQGNGDLSDLDMVGALAILTRRALKKFI